MSGWRQNFYIVQNKEKYIGPDIDKVFYRSSWEKKFFIFLDNNPYILAWASEPYPIQYYKPMLDKNGNPYYKLSKYYPDIYVEYVNENKEFKKELIEIKPLKQTKASRSKNPKVKLQENYTVLVNHAKWEAAQKWCSSQGIEFKIMTEKTLFR